MNAIATLEKKYQRELELIDKHKKNAADLKKEIEVQKGKITISVLNSLNLSGEEYRRLMKLLKQDKKSIFEAVDLVLGTKAEEKQKEGEGKDE